MHTFEVHDPSGATEITRLHASRLGTLEGKTIALLSDDMWQAHRILPLIGDYIAEHFPSVSIIRETELPMGNNAIDRDETAALLVQMGVDAVVVGNAS
ncbi:MAG: hypothetical protein ACI8PT_000086 [Gammaproteobacteria bacterium]|jgi:hypothetical protein